MKLVADVFTGKFFDVEVKEDAKVGDLKKKIGKQEEDLPTDRLILMLDCDERTLLDKDDVSLKEYNVRDGCRIYIFFKFPEKAPSAPKGYAWSEDDSPAGKFLDEHSE